MAKSDSKKQRQRITTPIGTAHYPRLFETDQIDDKFKVSLELPDDEAEALAGVMTAAAEAWGVTKKIPMASKDGVTLFTFKTGAKYPPRVVDSQNKPVPSTTRIGGGSKLRVLATLEPFDGFGGGVTARLNAVQVVELVEYGGAGFEPIEGGYAAGPDDSEVPF